MSTPSEIARDLAELATETIGPEGAVMKTQDRSEARSARADFINCIARQAIRIANGTE